MESLFCTIKLRTENREVSAKYSCGFPDPQVLPIIVESKDI